MEPEQNKKDGGCPLCSISQDTIEKLKQSGKEAYDAKKQKEENEKSAKNRNSKIKKISLAALFALLVVGAAAYGIYNYKPAPNGGNKEKITVFLSPTCSCCHEYVAYLKKEGFQVEEKLTSNMLEIKEKYGIPTNMESCHTSIMGDYFIEGHMPVAAIKKLLEEKPAIEGISLPGMPAGSPGMSGTKAKDIKIYGLSNGNSFEFLVW